MKIPHCDVACSQITLDNFVGRLVYSFNEKSHSPEKTNLYYFGLAC